MSPCSGFITIFVVNDLLEQDGNCAPNHNYGGYSKGKQVKLGIDPSCEYPAALRNFCRI